MPRVNIVVVTHNRFNLTRTCLESLLPTIRHRGDVVVNIVDNGSTDGSVPYLERVAAREERVTLWKLPRNMGVAVAMNLGWAAADAEYLLNLDNDVEIHKPDWLDRLLDFAVANDNAVVVGYRFCSWHETESVVLPSGATMLKSLCCNGALCLIPRKVHQRCGFWNEDFGKYGYTDLDYSNRATQGGFHVGYLENDDTARHLGYERDIDDVREREKLAMRTSEATGEKMYLLDKLLFDEGIRDIYVERRFLPDFSGRSVKFVVNPAYTKTIKLQQFLLKNVTYDTEGDTVKFDLSALKEMK